LEQASLRFSVCLSAGAGWSPAPYSQAHHPRSTRSGARRALPRVDV